MSRRLDRLAGVSCAFGFSSTYSTCYLLYLRYISCCFYGASLEWPSAYHEDHLACACPGRGCQQAGVLHSSTCSLHDHLHQSVWKAATSCCPRGIDSTPACCMVLQAGMHTWLEGLPTG